MPDWTEICQKCGRLYEKWNIRNGLCESCRRKVGL